MSHRVPFRVIAIVDSIDGLEQCVSAVDVADGPSFGVMLRDPEHNASRVLELGRHALSLLIPSRIVLISNSVLVPGIRWIHLNSAQVASQLQMQQEQPFGASAHSVDEALDAERNGASYVMIGPVFRSASKPTARPIGAEGLSEICTRVSIPVFAVGGIIPSRVRTCLQSGAHGVAAITSFSQATSRTLEQTFGAFEQI